MNIDINETIGKYLKSKLGIRTFDSMMATILNSDGGQLTRIGLKIKGFDKKEISAIEKTYRGVLSTALDNTGKEWSDDKQNFGNIMYSLLDHDKDMKKYLYKNIKKKLKSKIEFN